MSILHSLRTKARRLIALAPLALLLLPATALADASQDINAAKSALAASIGTASTAIAALDVTISAAVIGVLALQRKAALTAGEDVSRHNHNVMSVIKYGALVGAASTVAAIGAHFMA